MRIIDSHFHWWPRPVFDRLCGRKGFPRAVVNNRGGYAYLRKSTDKTKSWIGDIHSPCVSDGKSSIADFQPEV